MSGTKTKIEYNNGMNSNNNNNNNNGNIDNRDSNYHINQSMNYMEQIIMNKMFTDMIDDKSSLSMIINHILMIVIYECKGIISDVIKKLRQYINSQNFITYIYNFFEKIYKNYIKKYLSVLFSFLSLINIFSIFFKKNKTSISKSSFNEDNVEKMNVEDEIGYYDDNFTTSLFKWKLNNNIWMMVLEYFKKIDNFTYDGNNEINISTNTIKDLSYTNQITNLKVPLNKCRLEIKDIIQYVSTENDIIRSVEFYGKDGNITFNSLSDLFHDRKLAELFDVYIKTYLKEYPDILKEGISRGTIYNPSINKAVDIVGTYDINYLLVADKLDFDPIETLIGFHLLAALDGQFPPICFMDNCDLGFKITNAVSNTPPNNGMTHVRNDKLMNILTQIKSVYENKQLPDKKIFTLPLEFKNKDNLITSLTVLRRKKDSDKWKKKGHLDVILKSEQPLSNIEFKNEFNTLLNNILENYKEKRKNIVSVNIYELRLEKIYEEVEEDNPEYIEYKKKSKKINKNNKSKSEFNDTENNPNLKIKNLNNSGSVNENSGNNNESKTNDNKLADMFLMDSNNNKFQAGGQMNSNNNQQMNLNNGGGGLFNPGQMNQQFSPFHYEMMKMKQQMSTLLNNNDNEPPPKKIIKKYPKMDICERHINNVSKTIDTLYLPENDIEHLSYILDNFKNGGELLKRLELPHKLGVLLHGEAGTGKSTTIKVISCMLGKNPYYIDLSNVKTNKDLKAIFDHVNKNCDTGGILVFEDIDVMAPMLVLSREEKVKWLKQYKEYKSDSNDGILKEINKDLEYYEDEDLNNEHKEGKTLELCKMEDDNKLTLSYFLNLLDGTLCTSGTTFIMTTSHLHRLDKDLIRPGRVDVILKTGRCDKYMIKTIFKQIMEREIDPEILENIREYEFKPVNVIFHILKYVYNKKIDDKTIMKPYLNTTKENNDHASSIFVKEE